MHQKTKILLSLLTLTMLFAAVSTPAFATWPDSPCYSDDAGYDGTCEADSNFQVNVSEFLAVTLTTPDAWASGTTGNLLTNIVGLSVATNNGNGFIAFMNTNDATTNLVNTSDSSEYIATSNFSTSSLPAKAWGYNATLTTASAPTNYLAIPTSSAPGTIASKDGTTSEESRNIYFGAVADGSVAGGTYANTVLISVVSGVNTNPVAPVDPVTPDTPGNGGSNPYYDESRDRTTYVATTDNGSTTSTTTTVSSGDTRTTYTNAQGVTTTSIGEGTPLATGLAITAAIAASAGFFFFIIAKRRRDDDEEDEDGVY